MPDSLSRHRLATSCLCGNDEPTKIKRYIYPRTNKFLGIYCDNCEAEWLVEDAVAALPKDDSGELKLMGLSLHQYDLPKPKCACKLPVNARTKISNVSQLKEGDHFAFDRPYYIWHHGIVYNVDENSGTFEAVHWHKNNWSERTTIQKSWLHLDSEWGDLYRMDYHDEVSKASSVQLVVARAFSMIGHIGYNLFKRNCEHFASFCKLGIGKSIQSNHLVYTIKRTVSKVLSSELLKNITFYICRTASFVTAESIELGLRATNVVGGVIVLAFEGVFLIWDLRKIHDQRKTDQISYQEFVKSCVVRITEALFISASSIGMSIAAATVATTIGTMISPGIGTVVGFICGITYGVLGSIFGQFFGNVTGDIIGDLIVKRIKKNDRAVNAIFDLEEGDHVVLYGHLLHPRCHAIVLDHDGISMVLVTRSLYGKGIVLEWLEFTKPVYKVIYSAGECVPVKETLKRADSKFNEDDCYNLLTNNCKHFAQWCKER